jgi:catechol 2,3-dioxygenase-like lactoylglutathione lyase family enzyme
MMLLYVTVGTNDLARARSFYDPVMASLGLSRARSTDVEFGYKGADDNACRFWVVTPFDGHPADFGNGSMTAFAAGSRAMVDAFHQAALAHGGKDEGAPGIRPYHEHFYAAYVRDPDGNKLSAVCETP